MTAHDLTLHQNTGACQYCGGSGIVLSDLGPAPREVACPDCDGIAAAPAWYNSTLATHIVDDMKRLSRLSEEFVKRYGAEIDLSTLSSEIGYCEAQVRFGHRTRFLCTGLVAELHQRLESLRDEHIEERRIAAVKLNGWEPMGDEADEFEMSLSDHVESVSAVLERAGL